MPASARNGRRRCRVSGSRGAPSATASTRSACPVSGGSRAGESGSSSVTASPQMTCQAVDRAAPHHIQGAARDPDVAGRGLSQRGSDEGRGRHRRAGQHGTVVEEGAHPLAQAGVEDPHHQPQSRVQFLRPQRGMEVAQVVLAEQGERVGGLDPGGAERVRAQLRPLDDPHPGQRGDLRAVALGVGPEQDGHRLAVSGRQLLDDPAGERIFPADNEMVAAGRDQGEGGHGVILNRPGDGRQPQGILRLSAGAPPGRSGDAY